jgi:hypothetical protein
LREEFEIVSIDDLLKMEKHRNFPGNVANRLGVDDPELDDKADRWYIPDPERGEDLEKLRERSLLREFGEYAGGKGRLKVFRTEAVRAGFKRAWAKRDYRTIVQVAQRLPESVLQEDPGLLMYYDNALMRAEQEPVQGSFEL